MRGGRQKSAAPRPSNGARLSRAGAIVKTGPASTVRLEASAIGIVDIGENTTVRLIENRSGRHILVACSGNDSRADLLAAGRVRRRYSSRPRHRPGMRISTVRRAEWKGRAPCLLPGWVELARGFTQSLVPQGAAATIAADGSLSAPYFEDASAEFQDAVRRYDLPVILKLARRRDALTLLNLCSRATLDQQLQIYDRLNQLVPAPPPISRDSVRWWTPGATEAWWRPVLRPEG